MDMPAISASDRKRFEKKIVPVPLAGCWLWDAACMKNGYGVFGLGREVFPAHRVAWMMLHGPIPDGHHLDHLCSVRSCVNPAHLEPVPQAENNRRTVARGRHGGSLKTHCPRGHEYSIENTRVYQGRRFCRECKRNGYK